VIEVDVGQQHPARAIVAQRGQHVGERGLRSRVDDPAVDPMAAHRVRGALEARVDLLPLGHPRDDTVRGMIRDLGTIIAALVVATLAALLLGAINTGTALTFGQIAFAAALVAVLLRRP
jgi:hypothetical protein